MSSKVLPQIPIHLTSRKQACAPNLADKLGDPIMSSKVLGKVSNYMAERYGFEEDCLVVPCTGDNPSSLAGLGVRPGNVAISLGSSDTVMVWLLSYPELYSRKPHEEEGKVDPSGTPLNGSVFVNPVDSGAYMSLLW